LRITLNCLLSIKQWGVEIFGGEMIPVQVRVTKKLMEKLDKIVNDGIYSTRSEIIRDAIRKHLHKFDSEKEAS